MFTAFWLPQWFHKVHRMERSSPIYSWKKNECVNSSIESNLKSLPSDLFRPLLDLLRVSLMSLY